MPDAAPSPSPELQRRRALAAERARRHRAGRGQSGPRLAPAPTHRQAAVDDLGPAIAEGEPFTDDFEWTEAEWTRRLAGARFVDVAAPRF